MFVQLPEEIAPVAETASAEGGEVAPVSPAVAPAEAGAPTPAVPTAEAAAPSPAVPSAEAVAPTTNRRWRCTICGYIHFGDEPPEKCPACGALKNLFVEIDAAGNEIAGPREEPAENGVAVSPGAKPAVAAGPGLFDRLAGLVLKFHLHPITVHFPNGILPAAVVFLLLASFFKIAILENAAYFNLIFVLVMLPAVLLTGYMEWQKRYKGLRSAIFITKILCSLIVLTTVNILVFWRLIDPTVASEGSPYQLIYLGIALLMLAAAGIAGHLGGKLVFAARQ
ncbi:MAG: DUF2231 domain-containing protein [Desulforhopalus sp.]|jgi:uncharacterized membrane protein|nr:DUF2231 domain-containing protein [Desulforhopalus sp.]